MYLYEIIYVFCHPEKMHFSNFSIFTPYPDLPVISYVYSFLGFLYIEYLILFTDLSLKDSIYYIISQNISYIDVREFKKLLLFIFRFFLIRYDLHILQDRLSVSKMKLQIFCDNILVLKLFFSKIMNMKMELLFHPIQILTEIYNLSKFGNLWNIYDITNIFPYEAGAVSCNLYKGILILFYSPHIVLGI